jgi:hypothetical protein
VYLCAQRKQWYSTYSIIEIIRYTMKEAFEQNLKTGNFGPWEPRYITLCANGDNAILGSSEMDCTVIGPLPKIEKENKQ